MDLTVSIVSKLPKKKSQNPSLCVEKWSSFKSWRRFVVKIMDLTVSYVSKLQKKKCQNPSLCFEKWSSFKSWRRVFIKKPRDEHRPPLHINECRTNRERPGALQIFFWSRREIADHIEREKDWYAPVCFWLGRRDPR